VKTKKLSKSLLLNKKTVADLNRKSMEQLQGGDLEPDPKTTAALHCTPSKCGCVKSDISFEGYSCGTPMPCMIC